MWRHLATIAYIPISALTKFVAGLFLLRLCAHIRWMRATIWVLLVATGVFYAFYFFVDIFAARPVEYYWLRYAPDPPEGGRVNDVQWATIPTIVGSVLNIVVDWALAILPMVLLWNSGLDRRTKVSVCGVLAVGSMYVASCSWYTAECMLGPLRWFAQHPTRRSILSWVYRSWLTPLCSLEPL